MEKLPDRDRNRLNVLKEKERQTERENQKQSGGFQMGINEKALARNIPNTPKLLGNDAERFLRIEYLDLDDIWHTHMDLT